MQLSELKLDEDEFVELLGKLMLHSEKLQNNPPDFVAQEDLVADEVIEYLKPFSQPDGPLEVRKITYVEGRSNVIVKYSGDSSEKVISFVGSHLDVVPANPDQWDRNPFELIREGDVLYGRGVTDCLGHVAMLSYFFKQLAILKPKLATDVFAVFISNEESSSALGIGVDELEKQGELECLKNGPLFWVDSANFGPTLGTGGMQAWELKCKGKLFHSGACNHAINAIEIAMEAVRQIQQRFHEDFGFNEKQGEYHFQIGSSLKPTKISCPPGSLSQIPGECSVKGDFRTTPFYDGEEVKSAVQKYVDELDVTALRQIGYSKFELLDEKIKGEISLHWVGTFYEGVAVDMDSVGYKALCYAIEKVRGKTSSFSLTGSLPIIAGLQKSGFDVQITGFGRLDAYHANNEYGLLSEFVQGLQIVANVVESINKSHSES